MNDTRLRIRYVIFALATLMWAINQTTLSAVVFAITGLSLVVGVFSNRATRRDDDPA